MKFPNPFRFLAAMGRTIKARILGYETLVTWTIKEQRDEHCGPCIFFDPTIRQCRVCGCLTDAKNWLAMEKCPKGKWGAVWTKRAK